MTWFRCALAISAALAWIGCSPDDSALYGHKTYTSGDADSGKACTDGEEGCGCYGDRTCNTGLSCVSGSCVSGSDNMGGRTGADAGDGGAPGVGGTTSSGKAGAATHGGAGGAPTTVGGAGRAGSSASSGGVA